MLTFVQIPSSVDLSAIEVGCYNAIAKFMNLNTNKAKVGIRRIASEMKMSKNTALKYINRLADKGIITKKTHYNPKTKEYDVNEYTFLKVQPLKQGVVQIPKNTGAEPKTKIDSFNNNSCCLEDAKTELLKQFDINVVSEAIKIYLQTTDKINNLLNWLVGVCRNIANKNINKKVKTPYKANENATKPYTKAGNPYKTKFHFECDRSGQYTNDELEKMLLANQTKWNK